MQVLNKNERVLDHVFAAYIPHKSYINQGHIFCSENSERLTILECGICFAQLEESVVSLENEKSFSEIFIVRFSINSWNFI